MIVETEQLREKVKFKLSLLTSKDSDYQVWMSIKLDQYLKALNLVEDAEKEFYSHKYQ